MENRAPMPSSLLSSKFSSKFSSTKEQTEKKYHNKKHLQGDSLKVTPPIQLVEREEG